MKRLGCLFLLLTICGCSEVMNVKYENTSDGGCIYSEVWRPKQEFFDYFGARDADLYVKYAGVKCETIIKEELKDNIHKTPYNGVPVVNELPSLQINVNEQ